MKRKLLIVIMAIALMFNVAACRESDRVSRNLSREADSFSVERRLTVINQRTDTVLFQVQGRFSIGNSQSGELTITGENEEGNYYKHFVLIGSETTYVVEDLGSTDVSKTKYKIKFNPDMIIPFDVDVVGD